MPDFALLHTDDPLGLATADVIVLTDVNEELNRQLFDVLSEKAVPIKASAKVVRGVHTLRTSYEVVSGSLVLPFGVNVGSDGYRISAVQASASEEGVPVVNVTAVKPEAGTFGDTPGTYTALTVAGGYGVVEKFGGTCTEPHASRCSVSSQMAMASVGGDILTGGLVLYAYRQECTLEGYTAVTIPAGAMETTVATRKGRTTFDDNYKSWTDYLASVA